MILSKLTKPIKHSYTHLCIVEIKVGLPHLNLVLVSHKLSFANSAFLISLRNLDLPRQNHVYSLITIVCHSASQSCRSVHQFKRWRKYLAVKWCNNRGRFVKGPMAPIIRCGACILTGLSLSPKHWSAIWQFVSKHSQRASCLKYHFKRSGIDHTRTVGFIHISVRPHRTHMHHSNCTEINTTANLVMEQINLLISHNYAFFNVANLSILTASNSRHLAISAIYRFLHNKHL